MLSDLDARVIVVEHRDWLGRFGVERLEAVLSVRGRRVVVADPGETSDDLVRDMMGVLRSMCAGLCGRGGAGNWAMGVVTATKGELGAV